ncbi:DMT family transporter [uncultured Methylibium sp.]|uniref:DMT family transporter n=1 Tax=uncultured Methylibium sp. TaxID=381093 RepID=UPI0025EF1A89|nr:DMT family transporter [uncultured Methylibium sp.]
MPATALALVLAAALCHALWNLAAKHAGGDQRFVLLTALMIAVLWAPLGIWAAWGVLPRWGWLEWGITLASALTHLLYFTLLLRGYRAADLTVVYPVARGTGPLLSSIGAVLLLGEALSAFGVAGVAAVALGVFLIAGGPRLVRELRSGAGDPAQRQRLQHGVAYGAATGVCIAGYTVIDGYAVKVVAISPLLIDYFGNLLRIPFSLPVVLRDPAGALAAWRATWRWALVVAVLSPLGYVMVLYALQFAPLSHVAPAREVSMLFAALIGGRLLGEGDPGLRLAGAACIALGVAALALG